MLFRVQRLADTRRGYQPAVRHAVAGRLWVDVCKPVRRLSVAEQIFRRVKTDDKNAIIRIREVRA
jgi:hypothetical protein